MFDELAVDHEGRTVFVTGSRSRRHYIDRLGRLFREPTETLTPPPLLHLLALGAQIVPTVYARQHSMLPSCRVAAKSSNTALHGSHAASSYSRAIGMETQRRGAFVCLECIDEDISERKFSWFKRAHHLVGVDWCWKHGSALRWVDSPNPFGSLPHLWRNEGRTIQLKAFQAKLPNDGMVRRYVEVAVALMTRARPASCAVLNSVLASQARKTGHRIGVNGALPLVSDTLVDETAPLWWSTFESMSYKRRGSFHHRIDIIPNSTIVAGAGESYALLLALLYPSTAEALAVMSEIDSSCDACTVPA